MGIGDFATEKDAVILYCNIYLTFPNDNFEWSFSTNPETYEDPSRKMIALSKEKVEVFRN